MAGFEIINVVIVNIVNCLDVLDTIRPIFPFENFGAELAGYLGIVVSLDLFFMVVLPVIIPTILFQKHFITELARMDQPRSFDFFDVKSRYFLFGGVNPLPVFLQLRRSLEIHIAEITGHSLPFSHHSSGRRGVSCSLVSSPEVLGEEPEAAGGTGEPQLVSSSVSQILLLFLRLVDLPHVGRLHTVLFELDVA